MASGRIIIPNYMPALNLNGDPVPGAKIYFYLYETTTLKTVYTNEALTVAHPNPVVADADGVFPTIFADITDYFTVAITDANGAPIGGLQNYDGVQAAESTNFKADLDLSNVASATLNAKSVTPTGGSPSSLADALGLSVTLSQVLNGTNQGTVATGSVTGKNTDRYFTGNASGGTVYYGDVDRVTSEGANAIASVRTAYTGLNLNSTGLITTAMLNHGFIWKSGAGDVTNLRVWEGHVRHDGSGVISISKYFSVSGITLGSGGATGSIVQSEGYSSGEIGHDTLVDRAYDFHAQDGSACVSRRVSFHSELGLDPKKWAFLSEGGAQSAFGGWVATGKPSAPAAPLDVYGVAPDFAAKVENANPATPWGLSLKFSSAAPNNTTQSFLRCEDSVGFRLHIWSNGNIVNVNNSYGAISDERLKTEIEDAAPVLEKFAGRRFVTYRLKADVDGPRIHGVIAQDEAQHSPHLVTEGEDGFLSFNYAGLALETGQALAELLTEFRALQREVEALRQGAGSAAGA